MGYWTDGGKTIGVLGMGRSGIAAARLLRERGFVVAGLDADPDAAMPDTCSLRFTGGELMGSLEAVDGLVISPGVNPDSDIPITASEMGIPVIGEIELAFQYCRAPVLAVTGSNGKTTTAEWLGFTLNEAGVRASVAGNTGYPFSTAVLENDPDYFVLEVSSYQLQTIQNFRPVAAAILNVTPDHLARHGDLEGYRKAKARIFMNQHDADVLVLNRDDPGSVPLAGRTQGLERFFRIGGSVQNGAYSQDGSVYSAGSGESRFIMKAEELSIPGEHNLANALAVICLAMRTGIDPALLRKGLTTFPGVRHRIEFLRDRKGVSWVNDSKSTNPDSLLVALRSFTRPIILIAGGEAKQTDYSFLGDLIRERVKTLILIGQDVARLLDQWRGTADTVVEGTMERAVARAAALADSGDVVLLSPGCASFDQYGNFEERGDHFRKLVDELR